MIRALILFFVFFSPVAMAKTMGMICLDCNSSEMNACAYDLALRQHLISGDEVWVMDPNNINAGRYIVQGTLPGDPFKSEDGKGKNSAKSFDSLMQWPFNSQDQQVIDGALQFMRDLVLANGGEIYWECTQSKLTTRIPKTTTTPIVQPITIPPSVYESAYDLIGNQSAGIGLGNWISDHFPATNYLSNTFALVDRVFNLPINTNVVLRVEFSDGSVGVWVINSVMERWEADFDTFEDSDGNPIPLNSSDLTPGLVFDFSGEAPGQNNLENFLRRARLLGVPITGPGGDDDHSGGSFQCVIDGSRIFCRVVGPGS